MKQLACFLLLCSVLASCKSEHKPRHSPQALLQKMFEATLISHNESAIPNYYHPDLKLYTNGQEMDYKTYLATHHNMYAPNIKYAFVYDNDTLIEQNNKTAARLWLTISEQDKPPLKMEVILIAEFKEDKLYRLWELTYPDWTKIKSITK